MEFAKITIDDKEYTLAWDFNELVKAEALLPGVNLLAALYDLADLSAAQLQGLFYACLEAGPEPAFPGKSPQESLKLAGDLIRFDTLKDVIHGINQAMMLSVPDGKRIAAAQEELDAA